MLARPKPWRLCGKVSAFWRGRSRPADLMGHFMSSIAETEAQQSWWSCSVLGQGRKGARFGWGTRTHFERRLPWWQMSSSFSSSALLSHCAHDLIVDCLSTFKVALHTKRSCSINLQDLDLTRLARLTCLFERACTPRQNLPFPSHAQICSRS